MSQEINVVLSLQTANALQKLESFVGKATVGLRQLASDALAAYLSFEGLRKLEDGVKTAIDLQEQIGRVADQTGLSVPVIAAFRDEAKVLNVSFEELNTSLGRFSQNIFDAATKGGAAADAFERMGIGLKGADGSLRSTDAILSDVAAWFQRSAAGAEKSRTATELFGRAGRTLIPVLNEGADGIERMREGGGPITEDSVKRAEEFNKTMREVEVVVENMFIEVANNLLPSLQKLDDQVKKISTDEETHRAVVEGLTDFFKGLITVVSVVGLAFYQLGKSIGDAVNIWVNAFSILSDTFGFFYIQVKNQIKLLWDLAKTSYVVFEAVGLAASGHIVDAANLISENSEKIIDDVKNVGASAKNTFSSAVDSIKKITNDWLNTNANSITDAISQWSKLGSFVKNMWASQAPKSSGGASSGPASNGGDVGISDASLKKVAEWQSLSEQIFKQSAKLIEANPYESQLEKARELMPLLEEQKNILSKQLADAQDNLAAAKTEDQKIAATKEVVKIQGQMNDLLIQQNKLIAESTLKGQVKSQWATMLTDVENFSKDASKFLLSPIEGFRQGFAKALDEMFIKGRFSFSTLALGMLAVIRQSFVQMVSDWVVSHIVMKGISLGFHALLELLGWSRVASHAAQEQAKAAAGQAIAWANLAATVPVAVAMSLLWATPAALATIASYGGAAVAAPGLIAIAEALTLAESVAPRESGGPVSAGRPYIVGEKRPELFVPSQSGTILPSVPSSFGSGGSSGGSSPVHNNFQFHFVDSQADAVKKARANPEWAHFIIDVNNKNAHLIGRRE